MLIEIFESNVTKGDTKDLPHRVACRGIIENEGKYLVVSLEKYDITTFPGGGLEEGESLEDCVKREVLEETGILCEPTKETIRVKEYFTDSVWTNIYFLCDYIKQQEEPNLTEEEIGLELTTKWVTRDWLLDNFQNNMTKHKFGAQIHNREFLGLIHSL